MTSDNRDVRAEREAGDQSDAERPLDPTRRQFFRAFSRQTVAGAGNVIGVAEALRRGTSTATAELLGLGFGSPQATAARLQQRLDAEATSGTTKADPAQPFASAYAYSDDAVLLLDQRLLPAQRTTVACTEASEVATAMRSGVTGGGPILAEVAAHTLVLALAGEAGTSATAQRRAFDTAADTLLAARPSIRAVGWAVEWLRGTLARGPAEAHEPGAMVTALRRQAEAIVMELALDHARLGRFGAEALGSRQDDDRLDLLLHGELGPLSCGLVGTGFAVVRGLLDGGRDVHVWLTEGGPDVAGGRISSLQLHQLGVPHTLIPDAAVGWLFDNRTVDAVLVRLDTITPGGDGIGPVGAVSVARLAEAAGVAVLGCATTSSIQPAGARPVDLSTEMGVPEGGTPVATRLQPLADVVPARLMDGCLTEEGLLRPPFETALGRALESRSSRRAAEQGIGQIS